MNGVLPCGVAVTKVVPGVRKPGKPRDRRRRTAPIGAHEVRDAADVALKVLRVMGYSYKEIHLALKDLKGSYFTVRRRCMVVDGMTLDVDPDAFLDDARSA